jgi:predicted DNA-binding transcriptional regulator AlpA
MEWTYANQSSSMQEDTLVFSERNMKPSAPVPPHEKLLTRPEAAELLRIKEQTLATWYSKGKGPRCVKFPNSSAVRYRQSDIDAFIRDGEKRGTGE